VWKIEEVYPSRFYGNKVVAVDVKVAPKTHRTVAIINLTRNPLRFTAQTFEPYSLPAEPSNLIEVEPIDVLKVERTSGGWRLPKGEEDKLAKAILKSIRSFYPDTILVYLPRPALSLLKDKGLVKHPRIEDSYYEAVAVLGVPVSATARNIKPPVSILLGISQPDDDAYESTHTSISEMLGTKDYSIVNLTAHPLTFDNGEKVERLWTLNATTEWHYQPTEQGYLKYDAELIISEEDKEKIESIIGNSDKPVAVYVSYITAQALAKAGIEPTDPQKRYVICTPETYRTDDGQIVAKADRGQIVRFVRQLQSNSRAEENKKRGRV